MLPSASIKLSIYKAKDLPKKGFFGKADPYVLLMFGEQTYKSNTVNNNQNPEWNYDIEFDIDSDTPNEVDLLIFDEDITSKDDIIGKATISLTDIIDNKKMVNKWLKLQECKSGEVLYSAEYTPPRKDESKLKDESERIGSRKQSRVSTHGSRKQSTVSVHDHSEKGDTEDDNDNKTDSGKLTNGNSSVLTTHTRNVMNHGDFYLHIMEV